MFKYWSIKRYGTKLLPTLEKRFGEKNFYSASEVRSTIFQENFAPKYLPLGYLLFLNESSLKEVMLIEYPNINIASYKKEILSYLTKKRYQGYLRALHS
jgi:hypothetical protein